MIQRSFLSSGFLFFLIARVEKRLRIPSKRMSMSTVLGRTHAQIAAPRPCTKDAREARFSPPSPIVFFFSASDRVPRLAYENAPVARAYTHCHPRIYRPVLSLPPRERLFVSVARLTRLFRGESREGPRTILGELQSESHSPSHR